MAFTYKRSITFDKTKVDTSDQTNFPALVSFTNNDFKVVGSGGHVQNSNGYDICFYSDSSGTTPLYWEMEKYVSTTGEVIAWVKIPTLSVSTDTVIYVFYGDSGISTFQSTASSVWDSNFTGVYHYTDGTTLNQADSTANGYNGSTVGSLAAGTGQIDGALDTSRTGTNYSDTGNDQFTEAASFTFEAWVKSDDWSSAVGGVVSQGLSNWNADLYIAGTGAKPVFTTVFGTYNSSSGLHTLYQDGASVATGTATNSGREADLGVIVGYSANASGLNGNIDEVRISNSVRSSSWVLTSYNSQNSPSTFFTLGSETNITTTPKFYSLILKGV